MFRSEDFNFQNPEESQNPLVTYVCLGGEGGQWTQIDLVVLDIIAFS